MKFLPMALAGGIVTDDELTPVVLREEKVAGVGYGYLGERVEKYKDVR